MGEQLPAPGEVCEANGHDFAVNDVDPDTGDPLYVECRTCSTQWSCLGPE
jgi:hypothetical protein